jgi:glycerate-2-kinase
MGIIQNQGALLSNGEREVDRKARRIALEALEAALESADSKKIVTSKVSRTEDTLQIEGHVFDLSKFREIYVIGGGKASGPMAVALESILGDKISKGIVNVPHNSGPYRRSKMKFHEASHPIPDEAGRQGAKEMLSLARQADENDLVICLISGGGSSLMPLPRGGITLNDMQVVTEVLLKSGATINELNTVRKHLSAFKGGWLAEAAYPATVLNLILSDVVGDPLDFIASGPTVPDSTTFSDAVEILNRYNLWETMPQSVKAVLTEGQKGRLEDTPKEGDKVFRKVSNVIIGNIRTVTEAACDSLRETGLQALLLTSLLEGEARHVGTMLGSIAKEVEASGHPLPRPCGIVVGGETTVTVVGGGRGGRNQEIALGAALSIAGMKGVVIASLSTDGIDGPTDAAGAVVDGNTLVRANEAGLDAKKALANNDSYTLFSKLDDLIFTGLTETNVNDVSVIVAIE